MEKEKPTSSPRLPFRRTVDPKLQGELIELAFLHKAVSLGFAVAKPYGDSERYDFIVDYRDNIDRKLLRVPPSCTRAAIASGALIPERGTAGQHIS